MLNKFELDRGKVFVGGLHWQALSGNAAEAKNEAQRLAKQLGFDLSILRTTGASQIGFASTADGYKSGMFSAAAVVSKTLEVEENVRDFLCATELPDGRYLLIVQADGVITPDGDEIGHEEEIRGKILEYLSLDKTWQKTYAPVMWGIPGSVERSFAEFIPKKNGKPDYKHSWWALKPVKANAQTIFRSFAPFIAIGGVIACSLFGYQKWQKSKLLEADRAALALATSQQNKVPPHPWKDKPVALAAAKSCSKSIDGLNVIWAGNWKPDSVVCAFESGITSLVWKRSDKAWVQHLLQIEPRATIQNYGESASLTVPMEISGVADEPLVDEQKRVLHMLKAGQQLGVNIGIAPQAMPAPLPGSEQNQVQIPWKELAWSIKGVHLSPETITKEFDGPGFRIKTITAKFNEGLISWELEGTQYVLP